MLSMNRKSILVLFLAMLMVIAIGCANIGSDPIEQNPTENPLTASSEPPTGTDAPDGSEDRPEPGFYSMTMNDSYEKYGFFTYSVFAMDNWYDNGKLFSIRYVVEDGSETMYSPMTLKYMEYPDGDVFTTVCSDPLCTHTIAAGCPLAKCTNPFGYVCMNGKIFFMDEGDTLFLYDSADNSCIELKKNCYEWKLFEQDNALYVVYQVEDDEFNTEFAALKVTADGSLTELGKVSELCVTKQNPVYADRYLLDTPCVNSEIKAYLYLRDLRTDEVMTAFEFDYSDIENIHTGIGSFSAAALAVYGDKVLFRVKYTTRHQESSGKWEGGRFEDIYLLDLKTGEKRFLTSKKNSVQNWLYSGKCVIWSDLRSDQSDPFIVHILFVESGVEETYDLAAMAAEAGGVISPNYSLDSLDKGALILTCDYRMDSGIKNDEGDVVYDKVKFNVMEFNLSSGKAYIYEEPDLPEYNSLSEY